MKRKNAFTLAEVLIVLAIIGVVAALTIPGLIVKYQKEQTLTHLKKIYSVFEQAINNSVTENGAVKTWDFTLSDKDFFERYLQKYLSVSNKICAFPSYTKCTVPSKQYLDGTNAGDDGFRIYTILNSGEQIGISNYSATNDPTPGKKITVDLNGDKNPNKWGKDVFLFVVKAKNPHFFPYSMYGTFESVYATRERLMAEGAGSRGCSKKSTSWYSGAYCAALIIKDGWKINDDYPW